MKTKAEIIGRKKIVKLVTGLNYYSKKQTIVVLGKLPSKKINEGSNYSDWGLKLGLRKETITEISVDNFEPQDYNLIIVDDVVFQKEIDY